MTIDLLLKLLTLAPALEKDGEQVIAELKSDDDGRVKALKLLGDLETIIQQVKALLS